MNGTSVPERSTDVLRQERLARDSLFYNLHNLVHEAEVVTAPFLERGFLRIENSRRGV